MLADRPYLRDSPYESRWSASLILVIINASVYVLQLLSDLLSAPDPNPFVRYLALAPGDLAHGWLWQLLTFQFLHGGPLHLIINCAMLWMFGRPVESLLGRATFLKLYFVSGTTGGVLQVLCSWVFPAHFGVGPVLGASAGIFGLIAAFAALNWEQPITTLVALIIPVTMRAKYLVLILGLLAVFGMLERKSGIAHAAHLGGLFAGLGFIRFVVQAEGGLFDRKRFRPPSPRRELVKTAPPKRAFWRRESPRPVDDLPPAEFISREVDPILDKISAHGIQSLTERERKILEAARAKMSKR